MLVQIAQNIFCCIDLSVICFNNVGLNVLRCWADTVCFLSSFIDDYGLLTQTLVATAVFLASVLVAFVCIDLRQCQFDVIQRASKVSVLYQHILCDLFCPHKIACDENPK